MAVFITLKCSLSWDKGGILLVENADSVLGDISVHSDVELGVGRQECVESSVINGIDVARSSLWDDDIMVKVHVLWIASAGMSITVWPAVGSTCHFGSGQIEAWYVTGGILSTNGFGSTSDSWFVIKFHGGGI